MESYDDIKQILEFNYKKFSRQDFIKEDPISIPHSYSSKQDIEISAFFAAIFAWGQRKTIIQKTEDLMNRMDNSPFEFIVHHQESDLKKLLGFVHRTFNETDLIYFVEFLKQHYGGSESLETAFTKGLNPNDENIESALIGFKKYFFSLEYIPLRTGKHISSPLTNSTCKRLCMYLRWMVRKDKSGVDFGIWNTIKPSQLLCPLDVHVDRNARFLGLIQRNKTDWQTVKELSQNLKLYDKNDPIKYDFALFGMGIDRKKIKQ